MKDETKEESRECFISDNDGHWYLIPLESRQRFMKLIDNEDGLEDEFDYNRTIYHISQYSFTNSEAIGE